MTEQGWPGRGESGGFLQHRCGCFFGPDPNCRNLEGEVGLHRAAQLGHTECARQLLARGALVNLVRPSDGCTPLHLAASSREEVVLGLLLSHGADVAARDHGGCTPLLLAAMGSNPACVKRLIAAGADIDARELHGDTPLYAAAAVSDNADVLKLLLASGANVNFANTDGGTPLMCAVRDPTFVRLLLDAGADVNPVNSLGETALHVAVYWKIEKIVRDLVEHDARLDARDQGGRTAEDCAREIGATEIARYLCTARQNGRSQS